MKEELKELLDLLIEYIDDTASPSIILDYLLDNENAIKTLRKQIDA